MFDLRSIINLNPYSLKKDEKNALYNEAVNDLTIFHYENCLQYKKILDLLGFNPKHKKCITDLPFLPIRIFKNYNLLSIEKSKIIKTMSSSGTSGQNVSKIFLDKVNAINQTKVLKNIVTDFLGNKRLPMIVIDTDSVIRNRNQFSARGAGILGFSIFGKEIIYVLDDKMNLDINALIIFCKKYENQQIFLFGFTSIIWDYFYEPLISSGVKIKIKNAIIVHGGGWKKLFEKEIDNNTFKNKMKNICGVQNVFNYYGMVEQTGSIFMECEAGFLHCSNYSDVIMRRDDFSICEYNETGLIQLISLLPVSYPGHSLLSEDLGEIVGEDNCTCGRLGKYFIVHGRVNKAELRGCSDTFN